MPKKALLIGINDYRNFNDLKGCINDVKSMRKVLINYLGFEAENIRVVADSRATKENIVYRINWLVRTAESGDYVVLFFAGHGSQIQDRDGDDLKDHLDEIICPYDMDWDGTFITDDELNSIFKQLKDEVLLEVFLDCCHSGSGTRGLLPGLGNEALEEMLFRYIEPPFDISCRSDVDKELRVRGFGPQSKLAKQNHVLWSACKENQLAADAYIDGRFQGAFTHYVYRHIEATVGRVSRLGLLRRIRASLRYGGFSQVPQLVAPEELEVRVSMP